MIGIYGGTFDPVHFGHLRPALDVLQALQLEQIRFIPCGVPPHRQQPVAAAAHRVAMLQQAIVGQDVFVIDEREIARGGTSFMIDTINSLQAEYADKDFCLIIGTDAFNDFDSWKEWQTIVAKIRLVVAHRPNYDVAVQNWGEQLRAYVQKYRVHAANDFVNAAAPAVYFCPVTQLEISSTRIRELLAAKQSTAYLLPANVLDYINRHRLYC